MIDIHEDDMMEIYKDNEADGTEEVTIYMHDKLIKLLKGPSLDEADEFVLKRIHQMLNIYD